MKYAVCLEADHLIFHHMCLPPANRSIPKLWHVSRDRKRSNVQGLSFGKLHACIIPFVYLLPLSSYEDVRFDTPMILLV